MNHADKTVLIHLFKKINNIIISLLEIAHDVIKLIDHRNKYKTTIIIIFCLSHHREDKYFFLKRQTE